MYYAPTGRFRDSTLTTDGGGDVFIFIEFLPKFRWGRCQAFLNRSKDPVIRARFLSTGYDYNFKSLSLSFPVSSFRLLAFLRSDSTVAGGRRPVEATRVEGIVGVRKD